MATDTCQLGSKHSDRRAINQRENKKQICWDHCQFRHELLSVDETTTTSEMFSIAISGKGKKFEHEERL